MHECKRLFNISYPIRCFGNQFSSKTDHFRFPRQTEATHGHFTLSAEILLRANVSGRIANPQKPTTQDMSNSSFDKKFTSESLARTVVSLYRERFLPRIVSCWQCSGSSEFNPCFHLGML